MSLEAFSWRSARRRRTRTYCALAATLAAVAGVAVPVASTEGAGLPLLADCGITSYGGHVRPHTWSSGCTGGSFNTERLRWSFWGQSTATGRGVDRYNDCDPSCAGGTVTNYAVTLHLSRVRSCYGKRRRAKFFTRVRYSAPSAPGNPHGTFKIGCASRPL